MNSLAKYNNFVSLDLYRAKWLTIYQFISFLLFTVTQVTNCRARTQRTFQSTCLLKYEESDWPEMISNYRGVSILGYFDGKAVIKSKDKPTD